MSICIGDVNQSGAVTVEDYRLVLANSGATVDSSTFKYDVTHNGLINSSDYGYAQSLMAAGDSLYPNFAFTGHYYHARSGLYLAPYRAYHPAIGRWVSRDPLRNAELRENPNLYRYVGNDPLDGIDPLGLIAIYGNWCGPNWTGGRRESYTPHSAGYYAPPIDGLDATCVKHDICYYKCRRDHPCDPESRTRCFKACDAQLSNAAYSIGDFSGDVIGAFMERPANAIPSPTILRVPVTRNSTTAQRIGLCLSAFHIVAFGTLFLFIRRSTDPQAPMLWGIFAVIDFPVSLLYVLARYVHLLRLSAGDESWINQILYLPHLIHGLIGPVWWYFLPRLFLPRRLGGIW